ncbi:MAG TPA: ISLre2 family transposase [Syntrophomonadaceae bacterium]|jgi:Ni/Co efflux regulator RcnB|nr:ISLre2 family transposase [Syntrophomonadaceae bacterium]
MNNQIKFNIHDIEQLMWNATLETFQQAMVEILSMLDDFLMATRDKGRYEYKEKKERTYVTMLGPITINRRYYWDKDNKGWVFLLDQALELKGREQVSLGLKELVVLWATKGPSYRDVQERLKDLFGCQVLSHEKIRQILIQASDVLKNTFSEKPIVKRQVDALFIEADGFWTGVQRKRRRFRRKRETHMVVVHEGWERRQGQGKKTDYRLKNPMYITVIADSDEDIWEETWLRITQKYKDINKTRIIINGDLAPWIRAGTEHFKGALYQCDRFHLKREARRVLRGSKGYIQQALYQIDQNNPEKLLKTISKAIDEAPSQEKKVEMETFKMQVQKHKESIKDYRQRLKAQGVRISPAWRGMGAAESNVDRFKLRTAKRGRAWSKKGLSAIQHMLGLLYEDTLHNSIKRLDISINEKVNTDELIVMSAGKIAKTVGRKALGVRQGGFPATSRGTQGYAKLFRSILNSCPVG